MKGQDSFVKSVLDQIAVVEQVLKNTRLPGRSLPATDRKVQQIRDAAGQGDTNAQLYFTLLCDPMFDKSGQIVPNDHRQAANWNRLAAEQGIASTQYSLSESTN